MSHIFNEKRERTDVYKYLVNIGGEQNIRLDIGVNLPVGIPPGSLSDHYIEIVFINNKFDHCKYNFKSPYTRSHWLILHSITEKILELEKRYKGE